MLAASTCTAVTTISSLPQQCLSPSGTSTTPLGHYAAHPCISPHFAASQQATAAEHSAGAAAATTTHVMPRYALPSSSPPATAPGKPPAPSCTGKARPRETMNQKGQHDMKTVNTPWTASLVNNRPFVTNTLPA